MQSEKADLKRASAKLNKQLESLRTDLDRFNKEAVQVINLILSSVADLGSDVCLTPGSGMGKKSGSGSGMNNPDHISDSFETIFWVKILKFFDADPGGSGIFLIRDPGWEKFRIRDKHPGSATLILRRRLIRISVAWVLTHAGLQKCWDKG